MPYIKPNPSGLKMRYPAFAAVDVGVIQYWLTDAERFVDESWSEADYAPALTAAAAHGMSRAGTSGIAGNEVGDIAASGVTSFKSGTFSASFSEASASRASAGGWASTSYGKDYLDALYRNKSGFGTSPQGSVGGCNYGYNGFAGPLPSWQS